MPENKGEPAQKGEVNRCPACGLKFDVPLAGGVRVECADEGDGGCGKAYRVIYVD